MSKIEDKIVISTQQTAVGERREEKQFLDFIFDEAREAVAKFVEDRTWLIDAVRDERILIKDLEPHTRRIAAEFQDRVRGIRSIVSVKGLFAKNN